MYKNHTLVCFVFFPITLTNYNTLFYKAFKLSYYEINKEELDEEKKGNIKTIINEIYNVTLKNYLDKLEELLIPKLNKGGSEPSPLITINMAVFTTEL